MTKECNICGVIKDIDLFYPKRESKDGHFNRCKVCMIKDNKIYRQKHCKKHIKLISEPKQLPEYTKQAGQKLLYIPKQTLFSIGK